MVLAAEKLEQLLIAQAEAVDAGIDRRTAASGAFLANLPPTVGEALAKSAEAGRPLSATLRELGLIDPADAALLEAGEARGQEPRALRAIAERVAERRADAKRVLLGLAYPCLVLIAAIVLGPLPLVVSESPGAYLAAIAKPLGFLMVVAIFVLYFRAQRRDAPVRRFGQRVFAGVPPLSLVARHRAAQRFADVLGSSIQAGLDMKAAVRLACDAAQHPGFTPASAVITRIERGATLQQALGTLPGIGPDDRALISQGEVSGALPEVLGRVAAIHRSRGRTIWNAILAGVVGLALIGALSIAAVNIVRGFTGYLTHMDRAIDEATR
ncbi:MAG: type II secretion system F family protein [Myxococcota bacterium]